MNASASVIRKAEITLYSYEFSPFAAKVRCFLGFKNLDFETNYVHPLRARTEIPLGHQVPVLRVGDEMKNDSTPIGFWLDELYPAPELLPATGAIRSTLLALDDWVTTTLVPLCFRLMLGHGGSLAKRYQNGSIGANGIHRTVTGGYALPLRLLHPFLVQRAPFIREIIEAHDSGRPNRELVRDACDAIVKQLRNSPYLGGQSSPSLADLSAFAQLAMPYLAGYDDIDEIERSHELMDWLRRVGSHLPGDAGLRKDLQRRTL